MSEFKRSPSKVWWGNDSLEWREVSASPGSQDSGFSDTETSPQLQNLQIKTESETPKKETVAQRIPKDIFKELSSDKKSQNLSINFKEKTTPNKILKINIDKFSKTDLKSFTPIKRNVEINAKSEPVRKHRYTKNSPKVSRNLFNSKLKESTKDVIDNQYAEDVQETTHSNNSSDVTFNDSLSCRSEESFEVYEVYSTQTLPIIESDKYVLVSANKSAPPDLEILRDDEAVTSFNSLSSDCESELECLFNGPLDSPKHTSTPKSGNAMKMRHFKEKLPLSIFLQYQQDRVPPILTEIEIDNNAVQKWLEGTRHNYEQECMTTLQCKSIVGELNHKVSQMAAYITEDIRGILSHSRCIEIEYRNLNSEKIHIEPLMQSLAGNILDFFKTHSQNVSTNILKLYDDIRKPQRNGSLNLVSQLFTIWQELLFDILTNAVKKLVDKLEYPQSDLDLRATLTGITSIALRNGEIIEQFTKADIIPILLILCEKCEGSSIKSLILRALTTMCSNTKAVRQFEKYSGVQVIADSLEEDGRPEPERSEAVALLAQVTAPWIEDNHNVKGLSEYSRKLVKSLTKFVSSTKCCQNLLLCAAALANLSSMDSKSIKYMLTSGTVNILLKAVESRGPRVSVYLLEQVATLIANMSSIEAARSHLGETCAPIALLSFLQSSRMGEDVEKRLQQKTMIALSRLCSEANAAAQIVEMGGVDKLVKICREKKERYDSDAVLVAALATLRKITDTCGIDVISAQDAQELVEPKLLDSFLAYSTQNESYV